jgi:tryptophan synthase alpha chain
MIGDIFKNKKPFIGFVTAGDGGLDYCVDCCLQLVAGGVDILEIGLPFTDPVADGITIQQSSARALKQNVDAEVVLNMARKIREKSSVPLILFSYLNPLLQQGETYLIAAKQAGFDAVIVVDMAPVEELAANHYYELIKQAGLQPIYLLAPSTSEERIKMIVGMADGFLYYACQKGTTGMRSALPEDFGQRIQLIRKYTNLPIAVGFGIANQQSASAVLKFADGFVVGSAFVNAMSQKVKPEELAKLARTIDPRGEACSKN